MKLRNIKILYKINLYIHKEKYPKFSSTLFLSTEPNGWNFTIFLSLKVNRIFFINICNILSKHNSFFKDYVWKNDRKISYNKNIEDYKDFITNFPK